jgi:hypothetical protein
VKISEYFRRDLVGNDEEKMLFLTVYGPELESLFYYIHAYTIREGFVSREQLYSAYLPQTALAHKGQTKNIEDAINYLPKFGPK